MLLNSDTNLNFSSLAGTGQNMTTLAEKVSNMQISTSPGTVADDAVVPNLGPGTYMEMQQPLNVKEVIHYFFSFFAILNFRLY